MKYTKEEIKEAYQLLKTSSKYTVNVPDGDDLDEVMEWSKREPIDNE